MKLATFLIILSTLFIGIFAKQEKVPPKEYTFNVQEYNLPKLGVESNSILNLQFKNFAPNNVTWIFDFEEFFNDDDNDSVVYLGKEIKNEEDVTIFKFLINEAQEHGSKSLLSFIMQEPDSNKRINIFLKPKEENLPNEFTLTPEEFNKELEVEVESNFLLNIELPYDFSTAYRWMLQNDQEIDKSEHIELTSQDYRSACNTVAPGVDPRDCTSFDIFRFRIRNVTDNAQLPKLQLINRMFWQTKRKRFMEEEEQTLDIILKLKKNNTDTSESECSFHGYSCCTKENPKVRYQDKDGEWGVENGEWCFIKKEEKKEEEASSDCVRQDIGYPVCKTTKKVVTIDKDGEWGIENGQWCFICN